MKFSLTGKIAFITGAGSGIGRSIATVLAEQGAHSVVLDIDENAAGETAKRIDEAGGKASAAGCDVTDQDKLRDTVHALAAELGGMHIMVNNAGVSHIGDVLKTSEEDLDRVYQVNVKGVYNGLKVAVEHMVEQGGGVIVNMASLVSKMAVADRFAYSMSKGAVLTMTLSVARDYIDRKIRCNCICPARVHTPFVDNYLKQNYPGREAEMFETLSKSSPIGRMCRPEEVANLALYLCSDEAEFVTGAAYDIDGGMSSLL
jgi:NAD(P)-dependent dehydrogenase (short-subunit alcohol dehydrogenase family)